MNMRIVKNVAAGLAVVWSWARSTISHRPNSLGGLGFHSLLFSRPNLPRPIKSRRSQDSRFRQAAQPGQPANRRSRVRHNSRR